LRSRDAFDLGFRADVLNDVATGPIDDRLVVLRGPRRVGKSVALKDTIAALCSRPDVDPRQLVYIATDGMRAGDLNRVAVLGRDLTRSIDPAPRVWCLDEVTGIPGWTETLKYLRDNTRFGLDTVVCTGSSWDGQAEVERDLLAGRAGTASTRRSRVLLPMRFRDVVLATDRALPLPEPVAPWQLQSAATRGAVATAELFTDELDLAWQAFLTSGGFPRAVAEHHQTGQVSDAFIADLASWLHRDVDATAPPDSVALLLAELTRRSTSPLNRRSCSRALGYASVQTFDLRLTRLTATFAALWCHQVRADARRVAGSQSKLYLTDPLLSWLGPRLRSGLDEPDLTQLSEAALTVALARAIDDLQPGRWTSDDAIGYFRTGKGNEVDLAPVPVPTMAGTELSTPLESKWVSHGWRAEARVIDGAFGRGVLATRSIIDLTDDVWAIPAPVVALLLG
jgi:predicted AAA+ superfamily ATPase